MNSLFGDQLATARKQKNFTSESLAQSCGVSRSYITLIENGQRLPGPKTIPKIAQALGLETHIIVNWYLESLREKLK